MDSDILHGILSGTDKGPLDPNYIRSYERLLMPFRYDPITLLEIGVFRDASPRRWSDYFDKAIIVSVDIQPESAKYADDQREVEIDSQAEKDFLEDVGRRRQPDVIVDDSCYQADHVIRTFSTLFPHLRPGGVYIIEDIHFHVAASEAHRGAASNPAYLDLFQRLVRLVSCPKSEGDDGSDFVQRTDIVECFCGGVAVRKRSAKARAELAAMHRRAVEWGDRPNLWRSFAIHTFNNASDLADAVSCVRRAMAMDPSNPEHPDALSVILEHASDLTGALTAAEDAFRLNPVDSRLKDRITALKSRI